MPEEIVQLRSAATKPDETVAGVPAELIVRKGAGHGWPTLLEDVEKFADWFDKYLKPAKAQK